MLPWLLMTACHPCAEDEGLTADGECVPLFGERPRRDPEDTGEPATLAASCEAPPGLPTDPLQMTGQVRITQDDPGSDPLVELVDVALVGDRGYGAGQGGIQVYDISDPNDPSYLYSYPPAPSHARYHRILPLGDRLFAAVNNQYDLDIVRLGDLGGDKQNAYSAQGMEALAWVEEERLLLVGQREVGILVFKVSTDGSMNLLRAVDGPTAAWSFSAVEGDWMYAADAGQGVVPIDLSDPGRPSARPGVKVGGAKHVVLRDGVVYAAVGGLGVAVLDVSDPGSPRHVTTVETGGAVTQVAVGDGLLWAADHDGVAVMDLSDPLAPELLHRETTEQFALAVAAQGDMAWIGDWNLFSGFRADTSSPAPELDPPFRRVYVDALATTTSFTITNRGSDDLNLVGAASPGALVESSALWIPPGGEATLTVTGLQGPVDTTLCLASNDPDEPVQELLLQSADGKTLLGQDAPDFCLPDIDGNHRCLSDHLGQPVVLAYFATW